MAKPTSRATAVALIDLAHLGARAGALVQGPAPLIAALVRDGAADDSEGAVSHAKAQNAALVKVAGPASDPAAEV